MGLVEFQAIVMAGGRGSRMTEITAGKPKCLLPIGNLPMVWYPLQMLERAGIHDIMLVVVEPAKAEVQLALERSGLKSHVEIIGIPPSEDWGTADTLRHLAERIKTDVLVVSCDLITDLSLIEVLNMYRKYQASVTAVFFENPHELYGVTPGLKAKNKPERDIVGIDAATSRLVFLASASDFEEEVSLPRSLLRKHQHLTVHSQLIDSHLYVIRHWVLQYLLQERTFSTIKGELLPYIIKKQLKKHVRVPEGDPTASIVDVDIKKEMSEFASGHLLDQEIGLLSSFNDHSGDMKSAYHGDSVRCYAYIAPKETYGIRANTLRVYCALNRKVLPLWESLTGGGRELVRRSSTSDVHSRQIGEECLVGERSVVSEKTSLKATAVGARCLVEPKVVLTNCILMNRVVIREGCKLTNCIVCDDSEVGSGTTLTDCIVGSSHKVDEGESHANEVLTDTDRLMEI